MRPLKHIVAVDFDGGIGKDGKLPWNHSDDLKHFKKITDGHICIMGRKTYGDIRLHRPEGDLLPNRECYVVSNTEDFTPTGATKVPSVSAVVFMLKDDDPRNIFIIGGNRLFTETLPFVDEIFMTIVRGQHQTDTFYPTDQMFHFTMTEAADKDGNVVSVREQTKEPLIFTRWRRTVQQQPKRFKTTQVK